MVHTDQSDSEQIKTTHIGSLPRPADLLDLLAKRQSGEEIDEDLWDSTVRDATYEVVQEQAEAGIDIINNGEQPRVSFNWYLENRLAGIEGEREAQMWADLAEYPEYAEESFDTDVIDLTTQPAVVDEIKYTGYNAANEEINVFHDELDAIDADFDDTFITAASPGVIAATHENEVYDTEEDYLFALADAMQEEYELVAETGATLQIDSPDVLATYHRNYADYDVDEFIEASVRPRIEAINHALKNIPSDQVRIHTCWGSYEGPHHLDISLEEVLPELYEADVSALSVEQANPRHQHEYRAFAEQSPPDDWTLIPGVVDVKTNVIDHPEKVADRIERAADALGDPTRIIAAPDCGFGTQAGLGMVHSEIVWAKLDALNQGAEI
ncbi:MAG: methionine synthase, partial [Halobacteriaceae archaeon]